MNADERARAVTDVLNERARQDAKWGQQDHVPEWWLVILGEEFGEACQAALHDRFGGPQAGQYRKELVHVAAVAVQAIECLDRPALAAPDTAAEETKP